MVCLALAKWWATTLSQPCVTAPNLSTAHLSGDHRRDVGGKRSQRLAGNSERSTRPCVKGGQENRWNQSGAVHTSLDTLRSYLLPTEVEKVPWPHTMAVVHLEHNH